MLLTAKGKLLPDEEQKRKLLRTVEVVNQARNYISRVAFCQRLANKVKLPKIVYEEVRKTFCTAHGSCNSKRSQQLQSKEAQKMGKENRV